MVLQRTGTVRKRIGTVHKRCDYGVHLQLAGSVLCRFPVGVTFNYTCIPSVSDRTTVEPPSKGHFGEMAFVPCREVGPISEVGLFFIVSGLDAFLLSL